MHVTVGVIAHQIVLVVIETGARTVDAAAARALAIVVIARLVRVWAAVGAIEPAGLQVATAHASDIAARRAGSLHEWVVAFLFLHLRSRSAGGHEIQLQHKDLEARVDVRCIVIVALPHRRLYPFRQPLEKKRANRHAFALRLRLDPAPEVGRYLVEQVTPVLL